MCSGGDKGRKEITEDNKRELNESKVWKHGSAIGPHDSVTRVRRLGRVEWVVHVVDTLKGHMSPLPSGPLLTVFVGHAVTSAKALII